MKLLAIPLDCQKALHSHSAKSPKYGDISRWLTTTKWLVISRQKALHSHSAKSPKDGDLSRWLTATKWLVMLRCEKTPCLHIDTYAALQNFLVPANLKVTLH